MGGRTAPALQPVRATRSRTAAGGPRAVRPSTRTRVLDTGMRGSRVRCPLRQGRPGRMARASGRRTRSLPDSLPDFEEGRTRANSGGWGG